MKNQTPFILCILGGIIFLFTHYSLGVSTIVLVYILVHSIAALAPYYLFIDIFLFGLWLMAWFSGYTVIFGGYLLTTSHVRLGKFIIAISAGAGLISLIILIAYFYITAGWAGLLILAIAIIYSVWGIGVLLTIVARNKAK